MARKLFYGNAYIYLAISLVIIAIGFSNSYFGKLNELSAAYHVHGISATLWMVLLIVQPYLYKIGKINIHRKLGWISVVLIPTIIVGGIIMTQLMIQGQDRYPPGAVYQLAFIDYCTLLAFAVLYILAIVHRKNLKLHARYMVATIFGPLLPALTRVFFVFGLASSFNEALTYSYIITELVLLVIIWKERKTKEVKITYLPFLIFLGIQHLLMYYTADWNWWVELMDGLAG